MRPARDTWKSAEAMAVEKKLKAIANAFNYDKSDSMTDYYNTRFALHVRHDYDDEERDRATVREGLNDHPMWLESLKATEA